MHTSLLVAPAWSAGDNSTAKPVVLAMRPDAIDSPLRSVGVGGADEKEESVSLPSFTTASGGGLQLQGSGSRRWLSVMGVLLAMASELCLGQRSPNCRVYKLADGLPESACAAVTVSPQGRVLVRHPDLPYLSELDGYTVTRRSAATVGRSRIYQGSSGQLWTVVPEGLEECREGSWSLSPVPQIAAQSFTGSEHVNDPVPLLPLRQGLVLFLIPTGLMELNWEAPGHPKTRQLRASGQTGLGRLSGLLPARDGGLWLTGANGVSKAPAPLRSLQADTQWHDYLLPRELAAANLHAPADDLEGGLIAIADSPRRRQRLLVSFDGTSWTLRAATSARLRQAWTGPERTCWALSRESLFQLFEPSAELRESEEITARQYFDVAVEKSGVFWLATSDGLFRYAPSLWRSPPGLRGITGPAYCVASDAEGRLCFATGNTLYLFQNGQAQEFPFPPAWEGRLLPRALFLLKNGTLVLAAKETEPASGERLFSLQPARNSWVGLPEGKPERKAKALGLLPDGSLCLQDLEMAPNGVSCPLGRCDGSKFEPLSDPPPSQTVGTNCSAVFAAPDGDLWVSGEAGTACYHNKTWRGFAATEQIGPAEALSFVELADGKIWCATQDQIWEFDGRNWSLARGGFGRVNKVLGTRDGSVWVASNSGLHRFFRGTWIENGVEDGLPSPTVRELFEDPRGQLWAATTRGLCLFHPDADPDPPRTVIEEITATGTSVPAGGTVTMIFHGEDKWKYTAPERLLYSYRLDEQDWSPFRELNQKSFSDLPAGKHVLQVRAMDRNFNIEARAIREFAVILPWYQETRLILISSAGLAAVVFFAGLAFNRHRRLVRSYAEVERKVAERTEQLEAASRQLLHSQKMNALGTLAAGIAHDFNNILSIIKGSAQIIEDNLDNPEKIRMRAGRINTVVEQGAGIVKAMLGFSRSSGEQFGPCELNEVVRETLHLLGDRFLREVRIDFQPTTDLPPVVASKDFIQQILLNFIFNAIEAMDRDKRIILKSSRVDRLPPELVLAPAAAAAYVAVSVQDFGCGIAAQNVARIFEPFFTTKALSSRRGTGLGLSMAYELSRKLGAGLAVESTVDVGSTFTLILPVGLPAEEPKVVP